MLFSTPSFIFLFFPVLLLLYFVSPKQAKNALLLIASILFYSWGEPKFIVLMFVSICINYFGARLIENKHSIAQRKAWLLATVILNLSFLFYFKYFNFAVENANTVLRLFGTSIEVANIAMPIGISFYTFQGMSYVIDVYRKHTNAQKNIFSLALYISFFPQLIAGPIVRYVDVQKEIDNRSVDLQSFTDGLRRFVIGLSKKVIIANNLAIVSDKIFDANISAISTSVAWIGVLSYTLQIYYDFSGYSDMAIGMGRMFGFHFLENFNYPYIANSISDFWRRWHISLSTWFRDYVYIPLGGNRKGKMRTYLNLAIVFIATGFWHGANWQFILWGLYFGFFLVFERIVFSKKNATQGFLKNTILHVYSMLVVMVGWVIFRGNGVHNILAYLMRMFALTKAEQVHYLPSYYLTPSTLLILALAILFAMPVYPYIHNALSQNRTTQKIYVILKDVLLICMFALCQLLLASSVYNPFIYFRF